MKLTHLLPIFLLLSFNLQAKTIEFMAYNVENLFDTAHDEGKDDWTFTPKGTPGKERACSLIDISHYRKECYKSDWTPEKLDLKLNQISRVVLGKSGRTPDILALVEVENEKVLSMLARKLGYPHYVIATGPDKRGIDTAILYKSEQLLQTSIYQHSVPGSRATRNILEINFLIDGRYPLAVFVNHWPSQGNPTEARLQAAATLRSRMEEIKSVAPQAAMIAVGDFNTIDGDYPHPFHDVLLREYFLYDLHTLFHEDRSIPAEYKKLLPLGTHFYVRDMSWNLLDRVFFNEALLDKAGPSIDISSYDIYAPNFLTREFEYRDPENYNYGTKIIGIPWRYSFNADSAQNAGFSDHFAVKFNIRY